MSKDDCGEMGGSAALGNQNLNGGGLRRVADKIFHTTLSHKTYDAVSPGYTAEEAEKEMIARMSGEQLPVCGP